MNEISDYALTDMVWKNSSLRGSAKLIAIGLARAFDSRQGYSRYPLDYLVKDTGLSRPTILAGLKEIEESGEWSFTRQSGPRGTRYYPNIEMLKTPQPRKKGKGKEQPTDTPAQPEAKGNSARKPDTGTNPKSGTKGVVEYPETSENTDPMLNGLPVYNPDDPTRIVVPAPLRSSLAMAIRIHRRTDIRTRVKPKEFTVAKIQELIDELRIVRGYPLEAIDILLWLQCERRQPLNVNFMSTALGMCTQNGEIVEPELWDSNKENPAYRVAKNVYDVYTARQSSDQYVEAM